MKIVVVEDEIRIREGLVKLILKNTAHEVVGQAENGKDGLEIALATVPDLIITDVRMPVMGGLEMLRALKEKNIDFHTILLTAYSEFEYAQKAISLGVSEYLLKPIDVNALISSIKKIEKRHSNEGERQPVSISGIDNIIKSVILGGLVPDENLMQFLEKKHGINASTPFAAVCLSCDDIIEKNCFFSLSSAEKRLKGSLKADVKNVTVSMKDSGQLLIILYAAGESSSMIERLYQDIRHLQDKGCFENMGVGFTTCSGFSALKDACDVVRKNMEWRIVLGDNALIEPEKIKHLVISQYAYPSRIEAEIKAALWSRKFTRAEKYVEEFFGYLKKQTYSPSDIKSAFKQLCWVIIQIIKDMCTIDKAKIKFQEQVDLIAVGISFQSLEKIIYSLIDLLKTSDVMETSTSSLTINRVKNMVHEYYQTGISLEEIAESLRLTPEYLSTLFKEKCGVSFSSYIRNYRIKKAKELLLSTNLKLYEISEKVGYSDPKYFSRVFKGETGQLPADFRKTHK